MNCWQHFLQCFLFVVTRIYSHVVDIYLHSAVDKKRPKRSNVEYHIESKEIIISFNIDIVRQLNYALKDNEMRKKIVDLRSIFLDVHSAFDHCMRSRRSLFSGPKVDMIYYITYRKSKLVTIAL